MNKNKPVFGTHEWAASTINIQSGCRNDCKYCYAKASAIEKNKHTIESWAKEKIDEELMEKKIGKREGVIMFPSQHDVTTSNIQETLKKLKPVLEVGNKLLIVSKPQSGVISLLCKFIGEWGYRDQVLFRFTIGSADNEVLKFWEPCAPELKERIEALNIAHRHRFRTSVSAEPLLDKDPTDLIRMVSYYVTDSIWLGKMNHCKSRLKTNGYGDEETLKRMHEIMDFQNNDENIWAIYNEWKTNPLIRWKESIKKVVGLEIPTEPGLDI